MQNYSTDVQTASDENEKALNDFLDDQNLPYDDLRTLITLGKRPEMRQALANKFDKLKNQNNFDDKLGKQLAETFKLTPNNQRTDKINNIIDQYGEQSVKDRFSFVDESQKLTLSQRIRNMYQKGKERTVNAFKRVDTMMRDRSENMSLNMDSALDVIYERVGRKVDKWHNRLSPSKIRERIHNYNENLKTDYQSKRLARQNEPNIAKALIDHPDNVVKALNENPRALNNMMIFRAVQEHADEVVRLKGINPDVVDHLQKLNDQDRNPRFLEQRERTMLAIQDFKQHFKQQKLYHDFKHKNPSTNHINKLESAKPINTETKKTHKTKEFDANLEIEMLNKDPDLAFAMRNKDQRKLYSKHADELFNNDNASKFKPEVLNRLLISNDQDQHRYKYDADQINISKHIYMLYAHNMAQGNNVNAYRQSLQNAEKVINNTKEQKVSKNKQADTVKTVEKNTAKTVEKSQAKQMPFDNQYQELLEKFKMPDITRSAKHKQEMASKDNENLSADLTSSLNDLSEQKKQKTMPAL